MKRIFFLIIGLFLVQTVNAAETQKEGKKQEYWYNENNIELLPLKNRGISEYTIRKLAKFKVADLPRETPYAKFPGETSSDKKGPIENIKVPVELLEEAGVPRTASVRFGFPLPQGGLYDLRHLRVLAPDNHEIPAQFAVTGFWPDNSLKWVLVQFDAPLKANEKSIYNIECGSKVSRTAYDGIKVTETGTKIRIDTGRITAVIDKRNFNFINELYLDGKNAGHFDLGGINMTHADGTEFQSAPVPDKLEIIERGTERVTVRAAGRYKTEKGDRYSMNYVARLTFMRGRSSFILEFTHINTDLKREFSDLDSLNLVFYPSSPILDAAVELQGVETLKIGGKGRAFQETDQFFTINGGSRNTGHLSGAAKVKTDGGEFSVALTDCWKRWPKAFSTGKNNAFNIELLPKQPNPEFNHDLPHYLLFPFCEGKYRMKWGMSFTEKILFDLAPGTVRTIEAEANCPVVAVLPSSWYKETAVFPGTGLDFSTPFDEKFAEAFKARMKQSDEQREYGFFNYGDSYGERTINWTNNEYDTAHGLFMGFVRTGNREMLRAAAAAARHTSDVDTVHAYPDPYYVGANPNHKIGHTGGTRTEKSGKKFSTWSSTYGWYVAATNGHTWINGRTDSWQLLGDAVAMDSAYKCGDHITFAMIPNYNTIGSVERECGWALRAICTLYNATSRPEYMKAAEHLASLAVKECRPDKGGAWPHSILRLEKSHQDKTEGNVLFIVSVLLSALCDYYQITGNADVLKTIASVSKWMTNGFDAGNGCGFYYDCSWDGKPLNYSLTWLNSLIAPPLSRAAVLTDNAAMYEIARRAMSSMLLRGFGHKGKDIATSQVFTAEYLQSVADWRQKHPETEKMTSGEIRVLSDIMKTQESNWHMRGPETRKFLIRLKSPKAKLDLTRYKWGTESSQRNKLNGSIVLTEKNGRELEHLKFDPEKDAASFKIPLSGTVGNEFSLNVTDGGSSSWNIISSKDFLSAAPMPPGGLTFSRIGMQRFYFQVPAGKNVTVQFSGTHPGPFGMWIFGENGKLLFKGQNRRYDLSIEKMDTNTISFEINAAPQVHIYSVIITASSDGILKLKPALPISGTPKFFK